MSASADGGGGAGPRLPGAPAWLVGVLVDAGLDVLGALDGADYDARVPRGWRRAEQLASARGVVVVGSGPAFARRAIGAGGPDPVDRATRAAAGVVVRAAGAHGERAVALHAFEERDGAGRPAPGHGAFADFVALGEAAGLGVPSRLRVLLHPVLGPWLAVRSVVLTTAAIPPTRPLAEFAPCAGCPAPCRTACPAGALDDGPLDWPRCRDERVRGGDCATRCAARRACVIGGAHAHAPDVEAHLMGASLRIALDSPA